MSERHLLRDEFLEYLAALSPWGTFTVHRNRNAPPKPPTAYMLLANERKRQKNPTQPPMRFALPGERPKSRRVGPDNVIERFDAYAKTVRR